MTWRNFAMCLAEGTKPYSMPITYVLEGRMSEMFGDEFSGLECRSPFLLWIIISSSMKRSRSSSERDRLHAILVVVTDKLVLVAAPKSAVQNSISER